MAWADLLNWLRPKKTCILVVGMHRSGTSLITGILQKSGVYLGEHLMEPKIDNPRGFFEDTRIFQINEETLKNLGSAYDDPENLPERWWENVSLNSYKEKIEVVLKDLFSHSSLIGLKDPRNSILLPIYIDVIKKLGADLKLIVCKRSIAEVADSLMKRNQIPLKQAVGLYKKHYEQIEKWTKGFPKIYISMNETLSEPYETVRRISKVFDLNLKPENLEEFVATELKHHNHSDEDLILELLEKIHD